MADSQQLRNKRIQNHPGEPAVAMGDIVLSTLLGSCVAAGLFDPAHRIVGMNHFLLANNRFPRGSNLPFAEAGRYGVHARELLVNERLKKGQ